jgi:hypothetical protein
VEHARLIIDSFPVVANTWSFNFAGFQPLNSNRLGPESKASCGSLKKDLSLLEGFNIQLSMQNIRRGYRSLLKLYVDFYSLVAVHVPHNRSPVERNLLLVAQRSSYQSKIRPSRLLSIPN